MSQLGTTLPPGDTWQYLESWWAVTTVRGLAGVLKWVEVEDAAQCLPHTSESDPAPNVAGAQVEKSHVSTRDSICLCV